MEPAKKTPLYTIPTYQEVLDDLISLLSNKVYLAALYIDCSKVERIESIFGKKIYQDVLKGVSNIIMQLRGKVIRHEDMIVSLNKGSDEFVIFLSQKRHEASFYPTDLESLCERVTDHLNESIFQLALPYLRGRPRISVGYAIVIHNPLIRKERLLNKLIDDAKMMAKYQEFKRLMRNKEKLQELILKESIKTVFQPIVDFIENRIIGYEALTRGPEGTEYESPYILFDAAEETELIFELDSLCRRKALQNAMGLDKGLKLFVNCLPSAVHDPDFREVEFRALLKRLKIRPENLVFEVTEREAVENYNLFKEAVSYYSEMGFAIAVDDTGAGYSSLETVVELKPDFVKLDISIIRGIDKNFLKQELIKAISGLANKMGSLVIAEGIETEEELEILKRLGIRYGQGFLFARPGPPFPDISNR